MFIEIVHVNGRYSPETGEHIAPRNIPEGYYDSLVKTLADAASKGAALLYRPNLNSFTHDVFGDPSELERARSTDPFLNAFGDNEALLVCPDGRRPLEISREVFALENALTRKHGTVVTLGAYVKWCVPAVACNIASRNPGYAVGVDSRLSIDNGGHFIRPEHGGVPDISVARYLEEK